jgi:orotidine-5'-phosphate decarboxylase
MILAVTVLTSLKDEDLQEIGVSGRVLDQALRLAALARTAGCDGIVCSAREVAELRRELGAGFAIVTPGIRPAGDAPGDQQRVMTPAEAIAAGASHIVVGRPITASADPAAAARRIVAEIASACAAEAQGPRLKA